MRIFISSVVQGFEPLREAARRAVATVDATPVMCEEFGARPYSSERACVTEIEGSDIYVVILGERYGFEHAEGESVTQQEFRHAVSLSKPILVFIQDVRMEPRQAAFRDEVSAYHSGFCREKFSTPEELKDRLIQNLLRLSRSRNACSSQEFAQRVDEARLHRDHYGRQYEARFVFAFLPQPQRDVRLYEIEGKRDDQFVRLCASGLAEMRRGFDSISEKNCTGLRSGDTVWRQYEDGLLLLEMSATEKAQGLPFSHWYVAPTRLQHLADAAFQLIEANGGWFRIGLDGMQQAVIAELPERATNSFSLSHQGDDAGAEDRLLIPCTEAAYQAWVKDAVARLRRKFGPS